MVNWIKVYGFPRSERIYTVVRECHGVQELLRGNIAELF